MSDLNQAVSDQRLDMMMRATVLLNFYLSPKHTDGWEATKLTQEEFDLAMIEWEREDDRYLAKAHPDWKKCKCENCDRIRTAKSDEYIAQLRHMTWSMLQAAIRN